ncbi:hypothetical protein L1987_52343 [Smallanthus sonchifolius]|uniref:Uncharacterized protein n=1 Tax=Smallanthus sonchifolius TaxID=185202 RepID=A0ACB9ET59_9ASTR|nr:hypothetical protein L1987_52343 [Smallanthus sonchifolius]
MDETRPDLGVKVPIVLESDRIWDVYLNQTVGMKRSRDDGVSVGGGGFQLNRLIISESSSGRPQIVIACVQISLVGSSTLPNRVSSSRNETESILNQIPSIILFTDLAYDNLKL